MNISWVTVLMYANKRETRVITLMRSLFFSKYMYIHGLIFIEKHVQKTTNMNDVWTKRE